MNKFLIVASASILLLTSPLHGHDNSVFHTKDKQIRLQIKEVPSELIAGEPISFEIMVQGKNQSKVKVLTLTAREVTKKLTSSSDINVRQLSDGKYFADNITLPDGGGWQFTVVLDRGGKKESIQFNRLVTDQKSPGARIADFSLTDMKGKNFSFANLRGKVWVADFFFASCGDVCPLMTQKMARIQKRFKNEADFFSVSITTDPLVDTIPNLIKYADGFHADPSRWFFLTGEKTAIVELATKAFKLSAEIKTTKHSTRFAVVDRNGLLRGLYDSEKSKDLDELNKTVTELLGTKLN